MSTDVEARPVRAPAVTASAWTYRQRLCVATDSILLVAAFLAAVALRFGGFPATESPYAGPLPVALLHALVLQLCLYYGDLYEPNILRRRPELLARTLRALVFAALALSVLYFLAPSVRIGRGVLVIYLAIALAAVMASRAGYTWAWGLPALNDTVLVLGTGPLARQIAGEVLPAAPSGYRLAGVLGEYPAEVGRPIASTRVIGVVADLPEHVANHWVSLIVVALEDFRGRLPVAELLRCRMRGVRVEEGTSFFERLTGRILVNNLRPSWLVFSDGFRLSRLVRSVKRIGDLALASAALLALSPAIAALALLIKLDSRGPVFYRQERVGQGGRLFKLTKFRTMRVDAEAMTGPVWASATNDPRTTRLGRLLRKVRLDELPQLMNVVRGEMSLVGPRPERPHFVNTLARLIPYFDQRHTVKPGITGWAQIKFGYGSNIEDAEKKLQFDLYYIKHLSLVLDVRIVFGTLKVVLLGRGSR